MALARRTAGALLLLIHMAPLLVHAGLGTPEPAGSHTHPHLQPPPRTLLPAKSRVRPPARPPEPGTERAHSVDPRDAWMLFIRQSDKGINSKRSRGKARGPKLGLPGPPGPPGPQGPPGPLILPEALLKEFQLLLKGAVQQREHVESELCTRGPAELAVTQGEDDDVDAEAELALPAALPAPRVEAAFHCRLRRDAEVERRTLHELSVYYLPDTEGAFRRGPGLNLTSGQYTAPVAGFYTLAATLHRWRSSHDGFHHALGTACACSSASSPAASATPP